MTQLVVIGNFIVNTELTGPVSQDSDGVHVGSVTYPLSTLATVVVGGELPTDFAIGNYLWVNDTYVRTANLPSAIDAFRQYVLADLGAFRYSVETGGYKVPGTASIIKTDEASQAKIGDAVAIANVNPSAIFNFKALTGFERLDANQMKSFGLMIGTYVQNCFAAEAQHTANLTALQSIEDILDYDYTVNYWPSGSVYLNN